MNDESASTRERITAEGIENVQFPMRVRGYDREEVDAFSARSRPRYEPFSTPRHP